ncbi:MAG: peptidoglycan-binding protein [Candidatus Competibacter sp.]|nr:peptidoglycan-binding protein [Candidatus Competibacter sp.]
MAARFAEVRPNDGFDRFASPNWQMVPVGGFKMVFLLDAAGLSVASSNTAVATVRTSSILGLRILTITGVRAGTCQIQVGLGPLFDAVLDISVKNKKTVRTTFHYVDDGRVQKTARQIADLNDLIIAANRILSPQANIEISRHGAAPLRIAQNLRRVVRFSSHLPGVAARQHEWDIVTSHADRTADFNVFFVKEYEQDRTPLRDDTEAGTLGGSCIFEDNTVDPAGLVLAHELLHHLGVDHTNNRRDLMFDGSPSGSFIPKDHANTANP